MKHAKWLFLLLLALGTPARGRAAAPAAATAPPAAAAPAAAVPAAPSGLTKPVAVDVRSAPLADVLARASEATGVSMTAVGAVGDQRVTLHADRTTGGDLQTALGDLLRLRVRESGAGPHRRYSLVEDSGFIAQADGWRLRQANAFMDALLRTAGEYAAGRATTALASVRSRFQRAHPEFSDAMLAPVTADYLRQSLLVTALSPALRVELVRAGRVSLPVAWLAPAAQTLLSAFAQTGPGAVVLDEGGLQASPLAARVQFRLLYGDRWTGPMLLAQVGAPGEWTSGMLPSILFSRQDDAALYPAAAARPDDPDVWRRLPPHFDTAGKNWDTVLDDLAKSMGIKLAADSYARPWLFNTAEPLPEIAGIPLRDALDRLCRQHGCFWWKQDGWYLLRSRTWTEESRVAVPDRLLRGWVKSVQDHGALTEADLFQLSTLPDEQILTLNLESSAPGSVEFLGSGFNPNTADLMATSLLLFRSLPAAERQLAFTDGLPALWLPMAQQNLFAAMAAAYGVELLPENAESWSFRIEQSFGGAGPTRARRVAGRVRAVWQFGGGPSPSAALILSDQALHPMVEPPIPSNDR